MIVLTSWAFLNIAGNGIPYFLFPGDVLGGEARSFKLMNMAWNVISTGLDFGYIFYL